MGDAAALVDVPGALECFQHIVHPCVHLQNGEGSRTIAASAVAGSDSAFCGYRVPIAHS